MSEVIQFPNPKRALSSSASGVVSAGRPGSGQSANPITPDPLDPAYRMARILDAVDGVWR